MKIRRLMPLATTCFIFIFLSLSFLQPVTALAQSITGETETPTASTPVIQTPSPEENDLESDGTSSTVNAPIDTEELPLPTIIEPIITASIIPETIMEPTQTAPSVFTTSQPELSQDEIESTCYSVAVQIEPSNLGQVKISPPPNCDDTQYVEGTALTISAKPVPGFTGWSGDLTDIQNPLTVSADSDINLIAHFAQTDPPAVEKIDTLPQTSGKVLNENEITSLAVQSFSIFFNEDMLDIAGHSEPHDVTCPTNYSLTHLGSDLIAGNDDDQEIEINSVTYSSIERKASVFINNSTGLPAGKYQLRLNGTDSLQDLDGNKLDGDADGLGGDDFIRTFFININPGTPIPNKPSNNSYFNNPSPEFSWADVTNAVRYQIQIDTDSRFQTPDVDEILEEAALTFTPLSSLSSGKYFWHVRGINLFGLTGKWSSVQIFHLDTTPPAEPAPKNPIHGFSTNDRTPTFTWETVKDAKYYRLQLASGLEFETPLINILTNQSTFTIPDSNSLEFGTYFWRIHAEDQEGNMSTWSKPRSLVISFMKSPVNDAHVDQYAPTIEWYPAPDAHFYHLQVSDDEQFNEILQSERSIPAPNVSLKLAPRTNGVYFWRMCAVEKSSDDCESWQEPMKFTISPVPGIPLLTFPDNKQFVNDNTPELKWDQVLHGELPEAHHYEIQIDTDSKFLPPLNAGTTAAGVTSYIPSMLNDSSYFWRVRAVNYYGHSGAWSSVQNFKIDTLYPAVPVLVSPQSKMVTTDSTPKFTWRSSSGAFDYEFELSRDQFSSTLKKAIVKSTSYTLATENALGYGRYQWRVAARDQAGNQSSWNTIDSFDVTFQKSPLDNTFSGASPIFKWNKVSGAQNYRLQISNEFSFDTTELDTTDIPAAATSYTSSNLPLGQHYWRMQVQLLGSWSTWTPAWRFTISPQPGIPQLISPLPSASLNSAPEFTWQEVPQGSLPMPHAYQIQVSRSASFSQIVISETTLAGTTHYSPSSLADGIYFWRCRAVNGLDLGGAWSIIYKFILDTEPPNAPVLVLPTNNSRTIDSTPTFKWQTSKGAVQYQFQLSATSKFDVMDINEIINTGTFVIPDSNQLNYGSYYWRIKAFDAAGNESEWSAIQNFEVSFMKLPSQSAYLLTQTPTLSWEKVPGAQEYHLQVDDSSEFTSPIVDIHGLMTASKNLPLMELEFGTYYWRMKVQTTAGWGEWMPVGEFFITPSVSTPVLLTPMDKASTLDRTPTFFWSFSSSNGLPVMNHYELQISTNNLFISIDQSCYTLTGETNCTLTELFPGNYFWRMRAINSLGYASAWSAKRNLVIQ